MALTTPDDLEAWLGVDFDGGQFDRAVRLLDLASGVVKRAARQTFELVVGDVAVLAGTNGRALSLPEQPVLAVNTVEVEDGEVSDWTLLSHGRLRRGRGAAGSWGGPDCKITVNYDHGWVTVPADVQSVVLATVARAWGNPGNVMYEAIDDYRVGFSSGGPNPALTPFEMELLKSYRPRP